MPTDWRRLHEVVAALQALNSGAPIPTFTHEPSAVVEREEEWLSPDEEAAVMDDRADREARVGER